MLNDRLERLPLFSVGPFIQSVSLILLSFCPFRQILHYKAAYILPACLLSANWINKSFFIVCVLVVVGLGHWETEPPEAS